MRQTLTASENYMQRCQSVKTSIYFIEQLHKRNVPRVLNANILDSEKKRREVQKISWILSCVSDDVAVIIRFNDNHQRGCFKKRREKLILHT